MAGSWANVAAQQQDKAHVDTTLEPVTVEAGTRCAVLDASAVIGGHTIRQYADKLFTTHEVSSEIQDKQSKQVLSTLPTDILIQEPTEAAIAAGTSFEVDVLKVIALICKFSLIVNMYDI